jgi:hypothetical protein
MDSQDLPGGLAHQLRVAVDPDHSVVLGQLGDAQALLRVQLYRARLARWMAPTWVGRSS